MNTKTYIGVDLGGTTVTAGVVEETNISRLKTVPTHGKRSAEEIVRTIINLIEDITEENTIEGIGIGVPNPAGPESDRLVMVENIPSLESFPLKTYMEKYFSVPVALENDANCMALGEHRAGALTGYSNCVCITLGTGLGCGIVLDGSIYRGNGYCAGEIWNIPWKDGIILEDSVGLRGLKAAYESISGDEADPFTLYEMFRRGDKKAAAAFDTYGEAVGVVAVMIFSVIDPERIAVGGGISLAFDAFREGLFRIVEHTWGVEATEKIVPAALSGKASIIGAAEIIRETVHG